ncbi:MAG TPA: hypothetical protein VMU99_00545 [Acidimicrobiales bacterium]|nr:hypothetical protein [Acidimicrobiales bacterium]
MGFSLIRGGHHLLIGPLAIVLLIGGLIFLVTSRSRMRRSSDGSTGPLSSVARHDVMPNSSAERILSERFARGEIDLDEYREHLVALRGMPPKENGEGQAPTA